MERARQGKGATQDMCVPSLRERERDPSLSERERERGRERAREIEEGVREGRGTRMGSTKRKEKGVMATAVSRVCTARGSPPLRSRRGLVFKAHRLVHLSTPGWRVIKKRRSKGVTATAVSKVCMWVSGL